MFGIEDYGSDSDTEQQKPVVQKATKPKPKKIAITLPSLPKSTDERNADEDEGDQDERPAKRVKTGAGSSSLLSMLPKPKQSSSFSLPPPKSFNQQSRVLGGGVKLEHPSVVLAEESEETSRPLFEDEAYDVQTSMEVKSTPLFMPTSLAKGKKNISLEEGPSQVPAKPRAKPTAPAVDFFSLESTSSKPQASSATPSSSSISSAPSLSTLSAPSAAPELPTYEIPEPTPTDPYPGYYQLPSGQWAAHDVEYYNKFLKKWQKEYDAHVRSLEKGTVKGFEALQESTLEEVDALKEMEKARKEIQEREAKKAVTTEKGEPAKPRMNINASKTSGVARSRHQLSTLLKEAYENREALEERIAQGKRNRKEAGNKYGF